MGNVFDKCANTKVESTHPQKNAPWPSIPNDIRSDKWGAPGVDVDPVGPQGGGKQLILVSRPVGNFKKSDFKIVETPVPAEVKEGEALVQNILVSVDPTQRVWASTAKQYMPCVGLDTVMRAGTVGKVIKTSNEAKMPVGSYVSAFGGVQDYTVAPIAMLNPVVPGVPLSYNLSVFSASSGLCAWVGANICEAAPGKTIVLSGAAGAVGSIAAQIMKNRGARVIGIAGTPSKCEWLTKDLGLAGAINYKTDDLAAKLKELAPEGVDGYFDNIGGKITEEVLLQFNNFGRFAMCGSIAGYNADNGSQTATLSNVELILMRRITVIGFVCVDHVADIGDAIGEIAGYVKAGTLKFNEDVVEAPIEEFVPTVNKLFSGANTGKLMMKINAE